MSILSLKFQHIYSVYIIRFPLQKNQFDITDLLRVHKREKFSFNLEIFFSYPSKRHRVFSIKISRNKITIGYPWSVFFRQILTGISCFHWEMARKAFVLKYTFFKRNHFQKGIFIPGIFGVNQCYSGGTDLNGRYTPISSQRCFFPNTYACAVSSIYSIL